MTGYNHSFESFENLVPYDIRSVSSNNIGFGSTYLEIYKKSEPEKIIFSYNRNYKFNGLSAFYPFKYNEKWYAFISKTYTTCAIIDLDNSNIIAKMESVGFWCVSNFYVPAYYVCRDYKSDFKKEEWYPVFCDYNLDEDKDYSSSHKTDYLIYSNLAFVCGIYWGADYKWMVYKIDIKKCIETGVISHTQDAYCFEFDYDSKPDIKQFIKAQEPNSYIEDINNLPNYRRFYYYTQNFTNDGCF